MRKHPCSCLRPLLSTLLLLVCAAAFLVPQAAEAAEPSLWLYRERTTGLPEEQAADWARSAMQEDEHWVIFAFPQRPPTREESHTVWLTTKLSEASPEKDTLLFGTTGQSVKVWLDDTVIYSFGTMGPARTSEGRTWHYVPLAISSRSSATVRFRASSGACIISRWIRPRRMPRASSCSIRRSS